MHHPLHNTTRQPIAAWDPRWDDVTAVRELELDLTASDFRVDLSTRSIPFGTMDPQVPTRIRRPTPATTSTRTVWIATAALFLAGTALVACSAAVMGLAGLVLLQDAPPRATYAEVTLAEATPSRVAPRPAPPGVQKARTKEMPRSTRTRSRRTRPSPSTTRTAASSRSAKAGEEVREMSVSQLKRYLGASTPTPAVQASPAYARQAPAAPPRYVPAAAPTPKAPTYRAAAITPPPPAPVRRTQANGAKVVLYDGYAPLDPVTVTVVADIAGVQVAIDGQAMGPAPIKLSMEPGSHEVVLATAKGVAGAFTLAAGDGDAWCFSTRGSIKPVHCRKLK